MTQNQIPNQYSNNPTAPGTTPNVTGSAGPITGASPATLGVVPDARLAQAFLTQAFVWMFAGLLVTAGVAAVVRSNEALLNFAEGNFFLLFIAQIGIVVVISGAIKRISATAALGLFFVYAASLGITIGLIVASYTTGSVVTAFLSASAMFGAAAIYGHVTKRSLAKLGSILFMGLIGLLVAMVLNIFLASSAVTFAISIVGVGPLHGADRVRRPAHPVGRHRGLHRVDGEGRRHRGAPALPGLHQPLPVPAPPPRRPQLGDQAPRRAAPRTARVRARAARVRAAPPRALVEPAAAGGIARVDAPDRPGESSRAASGSGSGRANR